MSRNLAVETETVIEPAWGVASDKRGLAADSKGVRFAEHASEFVQTHPIGTGLTADAFDSWLQMRELLVMPQPDVSKNSDAWLGHLQRRNIMRNRLNKAANHPRMAELGSTPFILVAIRGGFEVRAPHVAVSKAELPRKISTLTHTKRQQLAYLMQSADWSVLPPHEQAVAETIYDDIEAFAEDCKIGANRIGNKLAKLEHRLKLAMDAGKITPQNGGLRQLIAPSEEEDG